MPWTDAASLANRLADALKKYDWAQAESIVSEVIGRRRSEAAPFPEPQGRRMLSALRDKRRFALMQKLGESFLLSGQRAPQIQRQLAQSLIEQAKYDQAELALLQLVQELEQSGAAPNELIEAHGLLGRLFKQLYVNPGDGRPAGDVANLNLAIEEYTKAYQRNPRVNFWPGINLCALMARAKRHGIAVAGSQTPEEIATEVMDALVQLANESVEEPWAWQVGTAVEARIALRRYGEAFDKAGEYIRSRGADAFELGSTLRQFTEVWELTPDSPPPCDRLLTMLRAMLLSQEGGDIRFSTGNVEAELKAATALAGDASLQAVLGADRFQTLEWYKLGLTRAESVARIEDKVGTPLGTGWLVNGGDFNPNWAGQILLLTNKHVISPPVNGQPYVAPGTPPVIAARPQEAVANLQQLKVRLEIEPDVVWTSPDTKLDATFVKLKGLPSTAKTLELDTFAVEMPRPPKPPSRVYVIGHPAGRDLQFSLQDNLMVDCDSRLVQYRAPTAGGSSGSPVFEARGWRVIALHHGGGKQWPRIDGTGTHEANEGIAIRALLDETRK